ncbi:hypothetical protein [Methylobacterium nigriterrae]|uniref:hypothetical protein n=1 Tax=Methylobacterium nigriterrae TaxID=3127512 RepID=UPI00301329BA
MTTCLHLASASAAIAAGLVLAMPGPGSAPAAAAAPVLLPASPAGPAGLDAACRQAAWPYAAAACAGTGPRAVRFIGMAETAPATAASPVPAPGAPARRNR